jgi:hypothetical protein
VIISFFADPLSRKDQQNKSALRQRAESKEPQWNSLQIPPQYHLLELQGERGKHVA